MKKNRTTSAVVAVGGMAAALGLAAPALAEEEPIEEIVVSANRLPPFRADTPFAVTALSGDELRAIPALRLDEALRSVPGLGLFRRASSLSAHPTTQGVTLRSLGPNGAGRTLVLLDGVPQNDPFGGWIYWAALDAGALEGVRVVRGSGTGRWGSGALSGVIELESRPIEDSGVEVTNRVGGLGIYDLGGAASYAGERVQARIAASYFESDGFYLLPADQRGPVDIRAASEATRVSGQLRYQLGGHTALNARAGYFDEERTNGLALSTNGTEAFDISLGLVHDAESGPDWQLTAFFKDRDFPNSFASVSDDRTSERMVLDQFDVPAKGYGAGGSLRWALGESGGLEAGFDARRLSGETNERFRNLGAGFTRLRLAGGDELLAGGYVEAWREVGPRTLLTAGLRIDHWRAFDGVRTESDLADGTILRDDIIPDRSGWVPGGRAGIEHRLSQRFTFRASGYSGLRVPTINELYRPFRVRNDITEANPYLDPERVYGFDLGFRAETESGLSLEAGYFRNWLKDGIGNVTIALGPGFFPPTGFVPAGGSLRERQNIERIVADGMEFSARAEAGGGLTISASYLYVDARVTKAATAPELVGNRLAQSPRHQASLRADLSPEGPWRASASLRYVSDQFDDDLGSRVLDGFVSAGLRADYSVYEGTSIGVAVENLFDARIESALSGDGLLTLGQPRTWWLELRARL